MVANINFENGQYSIMLADRPAWHDVGEVVEGAFSFNDVLVKVPKINFEAEKRQLGVMLPNGQFQKVDAWGVFRKDNNKMIGKVGSGYEIIQVKYAFQMCDTLLEVENGAHYESAGVLGNGERFFITARLQRDFEVTEGDVHQVYLLFCSSHDGSLAAQAKVVIPRVVCQNTLTQALRGSGTALKVRHTKNAEYNLDRARKLMQGVAQNVSTIEEKLKLLATRKVEKRSLMNIINTLYDVDMEDEVSSRKKNTLSELLDIFIDNDGNAFPAQKGTAFNLLNAITNHTDHKRGVRQTKGRSEQTPDQLRADSALFGTGEALKQRALTTILKETSDAPVIRPPLYSLPNNAALAQKPVLTLEKPTITQAAIEAETRNSSGLLDDILSKTVMEG